MSKKLGVSDILMSLPSLTPEERKQIRAASSINATHAVAPSTLKSAKEDDRLLLFYETLSSNLRERVGVRAPPQIGILPPKIIRLITVGWGAAEDLLEQIVVKPNNRVRLQFYQLVIGLTIDYVNGFESAPTSLKVVSDQLSNCASIVNHQFPGYLDAGLLPLILKWGKPGAKRDEKDL